MPRQDIMSFLYTVLFDPFQNMEWSANRLFHELTSIPYIMIRNTNW